jgi:hypothetical protein
MKASKILSAGLPALLVAILMPAMAWAIEGMSPPPRVVLMADPAESTFHVPARRIPLDATPSATIVVDYIPAGQLDPWGTTCQSWPSAAQSAMLYAVSLWEYELHSNVPIVIRACWASLGSGVLGYSLRQRLGQRLVGGRSGTHRT